MPSADDEPASRPSVDPAGAVDRVDVEDRRGEARSSPIVALDGGSERRDRVDVDEVDRRATEPGAGEAGADDAVDGRRDVDERVELRRADVVQVPEGRVARREQPADLGEIARGEGSFRRDHASV